MSRKYRQPGYQDSDRDDRERRPRSSGPPRSNLTKEERIQKRSLRHAIDRSANEVVRCHVCGRNVLDFGVISPETTCPHCSAPLHCCRICKHFDTGARWQCRAEIEAPVDAKSKANQCSHYSARLVLDVTGRRSNNARGGSDDPKSQFDNLFKR
jgi:hypothetical protein